MKQLVQSEIPGIEFHRPKCVNESKRVSMKKTRGSAIQIAEDQEGNKSGEIQTLFDAAKIITKSINKCKKWSFTGSLDNISEENLPAGLYSFFRWIIQAPNNVLLSNKKSDEVHKRAMNLTQSTVSMCLTDHQSHHTKCD